MNLMPLSWGRLAYTDRPGEGLPLLFLPGTGCDIADWQPVLNHLPAGVRAVCLDFRGHGDSDAPREPFTLDDLAADTRALMDHLALERAVLVGHSLGGIVAMAAAERDPRVAGLVLLEGWTSAGAVEAFAEPRLFGRLDMAAIRRIEKKFEDTLARCGAAWDSLPTSVRAFDGYPFLQSARIPILEVYGDLGRTDQTLARLRIPQNPRLTLHWLAEAGHYLPWEKPAEVAALCVQAIERAEGR